LYFSRSFIPFHRVLADDVQYYKHIGVYAFRKEALLRFASMEMSPLEISERIECIRYLENGMKIKLVETDFVGVGIDTPEDLERAKRLI
jgi:3-deoxy-manno-octulosonate cytidylyltransferase (CMP-KDO synthetase)